MKGDSVFLFFLFNLLNEPEYRKTKTKLTGKKYNNATSLKLDGRRKKISQKKIENKATTTETPPVPTLSPPRPLLPPPPLQPTTIKLSAA